MIITQPEILNESIRDVLGKQPKTMKSFRALYLDILKNHDEIKNRPILELAKCAYVQERTGRVCTHHRPCLESLRKLGFVVPRITNRREITC